MENVTDIIIGASSRVARSYAMQKAAKGERAYLISRNGTRKFFPNYNKFKHLREDMTHERFKNIEHIVGQEENVRIVYFAARNNYQDGSYKDFKAVNSDPIIQLRSVAQHNPLIYISTEAIFGKMLGPQKESSTNIKPLTNYGRSKREGELLTLDYEYGKVIRLGKVLGTPGDFISSTISALKEHKKVDCWDNVLQKFTGAISVYQALDKLKDYSGSKKIFHVSSSGSAIAPSALMFEYLGNHLEWERPEDTIKYSELAKGIVETSVDPTVDSITRILDSTLTQVELDIEFRGIREELKKLEKEFSYPFIEN